MGSNACRPRDVGQRDLGSVTSPVRAYVEESYAGEMCPPWHQLAGVLWREILLLLPGSIGLENPDATAYGDLVEAGALCATIA